MEVGATGVAEVGAVGIAKSAAVLGFLGMFVAIYIYNDVQSSERVVLRNDKKKRKKKGRFTKEKRHIPIDSVFFSPPSLSSLELETLIFMIGSSLKS